MRVKEEKIKSCTIFRERNAGKEAVPCGLCHVRALNKESWVEEGRKHFGWAGKTSHCKEPHRRILKGTETSYPSSGRSEFQARGGCGMREYHRLVARKEEEQLERIAEPGNGKCEMPS